MPSDQVIFDEMKAHIHKWGTNYARWYVGITGDIDDRLFGFHQVPKKNHWRTYRKASTHRDARSVETKFLELGCKGGEGGGDHTAVYVYAYLITDDTVE